MKMFFAVGLFAALAAGTIARAGAAEGSVVLNAEQAKQLAKSAGTAQEHLQLAAYYHSESQNLVAQSKAYAAKADQYENGPDGHGIPLFSTKWASTYGQQYRGASEKCAKQAEKAESLARLQEQMARP